MVGVETASRVRLHPLGAPDAGAERRDRPVLHSTPETRPVWTICTSLGFSMISVWSRPRRMAATRRGGRLLKTP